MYRMIIQNDRGQQLELTGNRRYSVLSVSGTNPPAAAINTNIIAGVDGSRFNSARAEQRNIVLTLAIHEPVETNRLLLYDFFKVKKMIRIFYKNGERDVYIDGYIESFENNPWTAYQQPQISVICPQPYWLARHETSTRFSKSRPLFEFPFSIPDGGIEFSTILSLSEVIVDAGEVETGCIFTLTATDAVQNPKIANATNGDFFGLNITMQTGDIITINTIKGEKSVKLLRGGTTTNLIGNRMSGSAWIQLEPNQNVVRMDADEGLEYLLASVAFVKKFEGV